MKSLTLEIHAAQPSKWREQLQGGVPQRMRALCRLQVQVGYGSQWLLVPIVLERSDLHPVRTSPRPQRKGRMRNLHYDDTMLILYTIRTGECVSWRKAVVDNAPPNGAHTHAARARKKRPRVASTTRAAILRPVLSVTPQISDEFLPFM